MGKQQGPAVEHREQNRIFCDKSYGKQYEEEYICIIESLCHRAEIKHNFVNQLQFIKSSTK